MVPPRKTKVVRIADRQKRPPPRRKTEVVRIADQQKRRVALAKRYPTLFNKAEELAIFTDSDLLLGVRSSTGRNFYSSYQRGKLIASNIDPRTGKVKSSTVSRDWEEALLKQECDACTTKEDLQSVVAKYEARLAYARERMGNWENNPSVRVDCDTEIFPDEEIQSILESFQTFDSSLWALCKDPVVDRERFWTSPVNSATGGASDPTSSGLGDGEFNMDELRNFSGLGIGNGDCPENSAIGGPSNPTYSGPDGGELNPDAFLNPSEVGDGDRLENSAIGGGLNPDDFEGLENLDIPLYF